MQLDFFSIKRYNGRCLKKCSKVHRCLKAKSKSSTDHRCRPTQRPGMLSGFSVPLEKRKKEIIERERSHKMCHNYTRTWPKPCKQLFGAKLRKDSQNRTVRVVSFFFKVSFIIIFHCIVHRGCCIPCQQSTPIVPNVHGIIRSYTVFHKRDVIYLKKPLRLLLPVYV